jgi:hypothetical protein
MGVMQPAASRSHLIKEIIYRNVLYWVVAAYHVKVIEVVQVGVNLPGPPGRSHSCC